jgi:hypothetical protein
MQSLLGADGAAAAAEREYSVPLSNGRTLLREGDAKIAER